MKQKKNKKIQQEENDILTKGPFTFVESFSNSKEYIMYDEYDENIYKQFLSNRAMSYHSDSIIDASIMNLFSGIDNKYHYDYYFYSLPPRHRGSSWYKQGKDQDINNIMEYYGYSRRKAEQALAILTKEQLTYIQEFLEKGGRSG